MTGRAAEPDHRRAGRARSHADTRIIQLHAADIVGSLRTTIEGAAERKPRDELTLVLGISKLGSGLEGSLAAHAELDQSNVETGSPCSQLGSFSLGLRCPLGAFDLDADVKAARASRFFANSKVSSVSRSGRDGGRRSATFQLGGQEFQRGSLGSLALRCPRRRLLRILGAM
ncbi:MAG: hypothetical protein ABI895_18330 [Deltaproteobacteria bacterium]